MGVKKTVWTKADKNKDGDTDVKGLGLLECQRVNVWRRKAYEELDRAFSSAAEGPTPYLRPARVTRTATR